MSYTFSYSASTPQNHRVHGATDAESIEVLRERLVAAGYNRIWEIRVWPRLQGHEAAYLMWMLEKVESQSKSNTEGDVFSPYFVKLAQMTGYITDTATPRLLKAGKKFIASCHHIELLPCPDIPERGRWMMEEEVKGENNVAVDWRTLLVGL